MKLKQFRTSAPVYRAMQNLAAVIQSGTNSEIAAAVAETAALPIFAGKPAWRDMFGKLARLVSIGNPVASIFAEKGNEKLPFVAFSSLPAVTCPGAGDCLEFCYSFKAWRYPAAFLRMAQGAYLLRFNPHAITAALAAIVARRPSIDLRLYVDGDFSSVSDVAYWAATLERFPSVRAYGYSKSYAELLAYRGAWPANYQLNISSGHCHDAATVAAVAALPIARGEFVAVSVGQKITANDWGTRALADKVRAAAGRRVFVCPGRCGTCTPKGHACGSSRFAGIPIAIAMH